MDNLGIIEVVEELHDFTLGNMAPMKGSNGASLGFSGMLNYFYGERSMDGYRIKTDKHTYLILIDNHQSCCESWGYFSSDDDLASYIGASLLSVELVDTALNVEKAEDIVSSLDSGGIQFVTFKTDKGDFQLAVYNGHNGYYGHGIIVAKDDKIIHDNTL